MTATNTSVATPAMRRPNRSPGVSVFFITTALPLAQPRLDQLIGDQSADEQNDH